MALQQYKRELETNWEKKQKLLQEEVEKERNLIKQQQEEEEQNLRLIEQEKERILKEELSSIRDFCSKKLIDEAKKLSIK